MLCSLFFALQVNVIVPLPFGGARSDAWQTQMWSHSSGQKPEYCYAPTDDLDLSACAAVLWRRPLLAAANSVTQQRLDGRSGNGTDE